MDHHLQIVCYGPSTQWLSCQQMTLYFICPAITVMLAWLVHGEAITWLAALGCAISLVGVAFIAQPPFLFGAPSGHYSPSHWLGSIQR